MILRHGNLICSSLLLLLCSLVYAQDEVRLLQEVPIEEKVKRLKKQLQESPQSVETKESLISALAALADERLKAGDRTGVEHFRTALGYMSTDLSDKLFYSVISNFPANLFVRGEAAVSLEIAREIEEKIGEDAKKLLKLTAFYLGIEQAEDALRSAEKAVKLQPDLAAAHQALGASQHIGLRLEDAIKAYTKALELDPSSISSKRSLADLKRATGDSEAAYNLYTELLTADEKDSQARAGLVLSLYQLEKRDKAEEELKRQLEKEPTNFGLLSGVAYYLVARGEAQKGVEMARKALEIEPRHTWSHIAYARGLLLQGRPWEAERSLRFAQAYGRFPTLDYEIATVLAHMGLYDEAYTQLSRSFKLAGDKIETRLAARVKKESDTFIDLLDLERRAGTFQYISADSEMSSTLMKGLFIFHSLLENSEAEKQTELFNSSIEMFLSKDQMKAFRQFHVANLLNQKGVYREKALEIANQIPAQVEAALDSPSAPVAVLAEELQPVRSKALATGKLPDLPRVSREGLSAVFRGRIEHLTGSLLFNLDKNEDAVVRLKRAVSVLPENSTWWRAAQWHIGTVLNAQGSSAEALAAYLKSYDRTNPNPSRRAVIESLYVKLNGSKDGLDEKIGPARN